MSWLPLVSRPSRYIGREWNIPLKNWKNSEVRVCLAYPDTYEIGMSYLGYKILYWMLNGVEWLSAERVFTPWIDAEEEMRARGETLKSLESSTPVSDFDFLAITIQYEMNATNILTLLDLSGLPLRAEDRDDRHPIVIGGGPGAFIAQVFSSFFDCFILGDGENSFLTLLETYREWKKSGGRKRDFLEEAGKRFPWLWVPLIHGRNKRIRRNIVEDLDSSFYPSVELVPWSEIVHDRISIEIFRGCTRGCRFCQAGIIYRPVRERSPERILELAESLVSSTGYEEISLTSLASCDYSAIREVLPRLREILKRRGFRITISLPSLRMDAFSIELVEEVMKGRKTTLTFAPEAGTQRLRDVINKNISEEDILKTLEKVARKGWNRVKLYFMVGLPTERDEDIRGMVSLIKEVHKIAKRFNRKFSLSISIASFVPKAHTPFQWEGQFPKDYLRERLRFIKSSLKGRDIEVHYHDVDLSFLEAVVARGDEKISRVIERAWRAGTRFDGWNDRLNLSAWLRAFDEEGIDPSFYATRGFSYDDSLPWDHIDSGVSRDFLIAEHKRALRGIITPDCRWSPCSMCGVCLSYRVKNEIAS
ncbi:MAG: TIGR03960 family B12-binding radical SAM protein [Synergistetes bacterium]|nr:TIGR03960 family B12-binding radical SAM protein [Synergistota bacterium]